MPPKRACPYPKCFSTDPAHRKLFAHREDDQKKPALVLDLVSSSSPEVRCSASPLLDVTSPAPAVFPATPGSSDVLILDLSPPCGDGADDQTSKLTRLKKRRMALESSSSGDDEKDEFRSALKKGVFGGKASAEWIDTRKLKKKQTTAVAEDSDEPEFFDSDEEEEDQFTCNRCGGSFENWIDLEDHTKLHDDEDHVVVVADSPAASASPAAGNDVRARRLKKRLLAKERGPAVPVKQKAAEPTGPQTLEELVAVCQGYRSELEAVLKEESLLQTMVREQPHSFVAGRQLQPHQIAGLNWLLLLHKRNLNGILADEMGLGKTVQAIALLAHLADLGEKHSAIVVVPASVVSNWKAEFERWCGPSLNVVLYYGSRDERLRIQMDVEDGDPVDVFLTTYTTVISEADRKWLQKRRAEYLIVDEAHEIRNSDSLRHKALGKLGTARRLMLTGTPLHNNLQELCSLLYFLNPKLFGTFAAFNMVLDEVLSKREGSKEDAISSIRSVLAPFILRRLKSEVLQLPEKKKFKVRSELSSELQAQVYASVLASGKAEWGGGGGGGAVRGGEVRGSTNILMRLRQAAAHPLLIPRVVYSEEVVDTIAKIMNRHVAPYWDMERQKCLDTVHAMSDYQIHAICAQHDVLKSYAQSSEFLERSSGKMITLLKLLAKTKQEGRRTIVFSQFTSFLDIIQEVLTHKQISWTRLDGQTPVLDRQVRFFSEKKKNIFSFCHFLFVFLILLQPLIDQFDSDPSIDVFLLSTKAGGVGITLTSASAVIFADLSFNPQWDRQGFREKEMSSFFFFFYKKNKLRIVHIASGKQKRCTCIELLQRRQLKKPSIQSSKTRWNCPMACFKKAEATGKRSTEKI